jgi:DnaJ-class molecular chaperone
MSASIEEKTGAFDARSLNQQRCPDCSGTGELRIDSENINEKFEVEKQTVITPCTRCGGTGYVSAS